MPRTRFAAPRRRTALLLLFTFWLTWLAPVAAAPRRATSATRTPAANEGGESPASPPAAAESLADSVRRITLPTKDIVYDAKTKKIYASVPSSAGAGGNSITPIDPETATTGTPVFVGSEPGKLALSDNGQYLYTHLEGALAIRRFDVAAQTAGLQFTLPTMQHSSSSVLQDMAVVPGSPEALAVSGGGSIAVYDNSVRRPGVLSNYFSSSPYIEFGAADTLYALAYTSNLSLQKISVTAGGAALSASYPLSGNAGDFRYDSGRVYLPSGQVIDAGTGSLLGTFLTSAPAIWSRPIPQPDGFTSSQPLTAAAPPPRSRCGLTT